MRFSVVVLVALLKNLMLQVNLGKQKLLTYAKDKFNDGKQDVEFAYCILEREGALYRFGVDKTLDLKQHIGKLISPVVEFRPSADKNVRPKIVELA